MANWTYTFTVGQPKQSEAEALWIWEEANVYPLSDANCLLHNKRTHAEVVVRLEVLNALQLCRQFRSLDDHSRAICKAIPGLARQQADVRQVLDTLARQGVLRAADDVLKELQTPSAPATPDPLERVFIRTCDRPELLQRLLDSLAANERRFANRYRYIVIDDSSQETQREKNAALIAALADAGVLDARYYGTANQQQFLTNLLEIFPSHAESLHWLLMGSGQYPGKTYGRGWNHALLLGAGWRFLMMDDDALCQAYKPPRAGTGIEVSTREEQAWFYEDREALLKTAEPVDIDPLAQHAALLGLPLNQVVNHSAETPLNAQSLQHLTPESLTWLDADSPVMVTVNSLFGDPGTGSNHWLFLNLDGESRRQFVRSEADYRRNCSERHLFKGYFNLHLAPDRALMTNCLTGLDNRRLLPPTAPEFAGEDGLFGGAFKYLYPQALCLQFPWGLPHLPEPPRRWGQTAFEQALRPPVLNFLEDLAGPARLRCMAKPPEQRMDSLAALYEDLAHADDQVLREVVQEYGLSARTNIVKRLHRILQAFPEAPAYWREDVQRIIRANSRVADGEAVADPPEPLATVRDTLHRYAAALRIWPTLWAYCRENRSTFLPEGTWE